MPHSRPLGRGIISIHAPHEGERRVINAVVVSLAAFQSTLPTRGSDQILTCKEILEDEISIHAPHEGERLCFRHALRRRQYISIHAPHEGERRTPSSAVPRRTSNFNPRSPRGGATTAICRFKERPCHFNPRSPRGGATHNKRRRRLGKIYFNPRSPRGGATPPNWRGWWTDGFQSTLPTRGSDRRKRPRCGFQGISIHAPHEGERHTHRQAKRGRYRISIHAPHEGERRYRAKITIGTDAFQSTLPTRGSDPAVAPPPWVGLWDFNPRSPRGGATLWRQLLNNWRGFQSTLPTRGSDVGYGFIAEWSVEFQSTLPTRGSDICLNYRHISMILFQSTLPTRGSDVQTANCTAATDIISIHAPHEGERQRKSAFVYSISANLLNIIHCGTVTRAVSRRRIALFRLFSVRRSGVFMYAYASH